MRMLMPVFLLFISACSSRQDVGSLTMIRCKDDDLISEQLMVTIFPDQFFYDAPIDESSMLRRIDSNLRWGKGFERVHVDVIWGENNMGLSEKVVSFLKAANSKKWPYSLSIRRSGTGGRFEKINLRTCCDGSFCSSNRLDVFSNGVFLNDNIIDIKGLDPGLTGHFDLVLDVNVFCEKGAFDKLSKIFYYLNAKQETGYYPRCYTVSLRSGH